MKINSYNEANARKVRATPSVPLFALSNVIDLDDTEINQEEFSEPTTKKQKAVTSEVWKHFLKVGVVDGKEKCKCKGCGKFMSCAASDGTSHLTRRVNSYRLIPKLHDVGDMILDAEGRLRKKSLIMLKSAINYCRAFYSLSLRDSNFKFCPSSEEWARSEIICDLLKHFYNITNLISGSSYTTSNLYFGEIWNIECLLNSYLISKDSLIQDMAKKMREKFYKYWSECNIILAFGAILDQPKKFKFLNFAYTKIDENTSEVKCKKIKGELYELYAEYVKHGNSPNPNFSQVVPTFGGLKDYLASSLYIYEEFEEHESQASNNTGKSELDAYLDEQRLPSLVGFDILAYWREKSRRCPNLARMACDILSIPITTVASESAFSISSRVLNKCRSSMKEEYIQALMCT